MDMLDILQPSDTLQKRDRNLSGDIQRVETREVVPHVPISNPTTARASSLRSNTTVPSMAHRAIGATILQIWEGTVSQCLPDSIVAILRDKSGGLPDHTATISREWIHEQDYDLVEMGAVFYLTLFKEKQRGSLSNKEELRFRRTPNWSAKNLAKLKELAAEL